LNEAHIVINTATEISKLKQKVELGMHRILFLPDIRPAGYPANPKAGYPVRAGYRISGRILGLTTIRIFGKISNKFIKTGLTITIDFWKH
jgi:hypothetical protein